MQVSANSSRPQWLLWIALIGTLGLAYWVGQAPEDMPASETLSLSHPAGQQKTVPTQQRTVQPPEQPVARKDDSPTHAEVTQTVFSWQRPAVSPKVAHPLFAAQAWLPPPPKPEPPPPPVAPPLPFSYVGSMHDMPDGSTIILMQQKKVLMPKLGALVTPQWRLDREDTQSVYFTYLPLNQPKLLSKTGNAASVRAQPADPNENNASEMANQ